jgi:Family of unknown function (DUF6941)
MAIIPMAKALYLCEEIDIEGGQVNVYALFNTMHAEELPHTRESLCVFAQLSGGLGEMPAHYDIVRARDERVVDVSATHRLRFERRSQLLQLSMTFKGVIFEEPGVYFVQLFCDNVLVADVTLELRETK